MLLYKCFCLLISLVIMCFSLNPSINIVCFCTTLIMAFNATVLSMCTCFDCTLAVCHIIYLYFLSLLMLPPSSINWYWCKSGEVLEDRRGVRVQLLQVVNDTECLILLYRAWSAWKQSHRHFKNRHVEPSKFEMIWSIAWFLCSSWVPCNTLYNNSVYCFSCRMCATSRRNHWPQCSILQSWFTGYCCP